jgi:hypothetical protein
MALESPVQRDGDAGFLGFASRLNPLTLPAGMLQDSVNMRLDRGVAQTRKGSKRLTDTIGTTGAPLTLDFSLGTDKTVSSLTRSVSTATATATAHGFTTGDQVNIRGAAQAEYNGDFIVTVTDANTFTYTVTGNPATPATGTIIANNGPEVRDSYDGGLYAAGVFASQNYDNASEWIALAGRDTCFLWRDGQSSVTKTFPQSPAEVIDGTDTVSVVQAFDRLYILREADQTVVGWEKRSVTAGGITVSGTTATVNLTAHGYPQGARVRIDGSTTPAFSGHEYDIQSTATNSFTITVPSGTAPDTTLTGRTVRRVKPPIYWDGGTGDFVRAAAGVPSEGVTYTKMPSVGWASYINNRLWIAKNRDTVGISDVLDPDLYDPFFNSFRAGAGGDDRIVAIHPWVEGQALVFCRKSIWLATLNQFASTDGSGFSVDTPVSGLTLLTNEIGCSARNSIVTAGNFVFFLSDAGIYRLDSRLDLKLRGDTMPLSEPIADLFGTVVQSRVERSAFGIWHNNRYLIALPISPDPLDGNQLVLAWNALNNSWEYRDTYPSSASVNIILVGTYNNQRRVFSVPRSGNLYLLEQEDSALDDNAVNAGTSPVTGSIKTRRYDFGDMHSKRFLRTIADVVIPEGGSVTTKISTINPDTETIVGTLTNGSAGPEDYNMKTPVRYKAHSAEVIYETSGGRPEIRSASIEASPKGLPSTETRSAA